MVEICEPGGAGLIFPLGGAWETGLSHGLRGFLYALGLVYLFLGIAILADTFMSGIEAVTSWRVRRPRENGHGFRTTLLWNETVATLSLMALGSSAPEIILAIVDIFKKNFHFGTIGPSCIVGSAAFNLFCITAVCVVVIPSDEVRAIENLPAFYITAFFSILAYLWMAFILLVTSPDIVEFWEAIITLLLLVVLIYVSYKVDMGAGSGILRRLGVLDEEEEASAADGHLTFAQEHLHLVVPGGEEARTIEVTVLREASPTGEAGRASCSFRTEAVSAVPGIDFQEASGTLEFEPGELKKQVELELPAKSWRRLDRVLLVVLEDAEGGPRFNAADDGGEEAAILTVTLQAFGPSPGTLVLLVDVCFGVDSLLYGLRLWQEQIVAAFFVNGSAEEMAEASLRDWIMHLICLPWNLLFLVTPPTSFGGGWVSFCFTLFAIGVLTAGVSDLSELFGCVLNIPDFITAITFVAMGTSMPDLFASLVSAKEDPTADASIVNVTGSNSVNVFLGLGVPWTIAASYWWAVGRTPEWAALYPEVAAQVSDAVFVVKAGQLGFSVVVFILLCMLALVLIWARRKYQQAELGGPLVPKLATTFALVYFWLTWVALVSTQVLRWSLPGADMGEFAGVLIAAAVVSISVTVGAIYSMRRTGGLPPPGPDGGVLDEASPEKASASREHAEGEMVASLKDSASMEHSSAPAPVAEKPTSLRDSASMKHACAPAPFTFDDPVLEPCGARALRRSRERRINGCAVLWCSFWHRLFIGVPAAEAARFSG